MAISMMTFYGESVKKIFFSEKVIYKLFHS